MYRKRALFLPLFLLFFLLGLVLMLGTCYLCGISIDAPVWMTRAPEAAKTCTEEFMEAVCRQDLPAAQTCLSGSTLLSKEEEAMPPYAQQLWDAYYDSVEYRFEGDCTTNGNNLVRTVTVSALDISALMVPVKEQYHGVIEAAVDSAEDPSLVYDEKGQYREEFALEALEQTIAAVLTQDAPTRETTLTLTLQQEGELWKIQATPELIRFLSGGLG